MVTILDYKLLQIHCSLCYDWVMVVAILDFRSTKNYFWFRQHAQCKLLLKWNKALSLSPQLYHILVIETIFLLNNWTVFYLNQDTSLSKTTVLKCLHFDMKAIFDCGYVYDIYCHFQINNEMFKSRNTQSNSYQLIQS